MSVKTLRNTYQIKVTLNGVRPPIWRRILIPSDITLGNLHTVLQIVMGWTNSHLHQFISGRTLYGIQDDDFMFDLDIEDENKYRINDLLKKEKDWIKYEYDFGDGWEHKILLEKILPFEKDKLPICIKGKRACPPEDCGGIWGYQNLLEILQDPEHEEYEDFIEWLDGKFESEAFNIEEINQILTKYT